MTIRRGGALLGRADSGTGHLWGSGVAWVWGARVMARVTPPPPGCCVRAVTHICSALC
jgi:hypothetical protein